MSGCNGNDQHTSGSSSGKRCECGEGDSERLWTDFESCAQNVARLYRDSSWRNFQSTAASTTELYKSSCDSYRRGLEKGLQNGRAVLAKEILSAFSGTKVDFNGVLEILYRNVRASTDESNMLTDPVTISPDTLSALHLFQQALSHQSMGSPQRDRPDLNSFLVSQVQNRRKRSRSPSSSPQPPFLIKKSRKF
ncbi:hypothetical protein WR25_25020 [Diploscapter pachys]|uniref:Uncharacterized protein n=1 Tax=Diploscapter pachys TaxID=2018661 RepID=A0A2A2JZV2_9BILA|nr:hypothetical protein WR25_25020 [Diploscapter pachys]